MVKPNLFIVGAAKCGTTSLYEYLDNHPEIYMSSVKEPHFFSDAESSNPFDYLPPVDGEKYHKKIVRDEKVYLSLFSAAADFPVRGEGSVSYLPDLNAASKIYAFNPDAKIIAILRNPVERAFSHFKANCMIGTAMFPNDFYKEIITDWNLEGKKWGVKGRLYVELGFYTEQLAKYSNLFAKGNILILNFSEFKKDPRLVMDKVFNFLNVENSPLIQYDKVHNDSKKMKSAFFLKLRKIKDNSVFLKKLSRQVPFAFKNKLYTNKVDKQEIDAQSLTFLTGIYADEVKKVKEIYGVNLE